MAINEERVGYLVDDLLSDQHKQARGFLCKRDPETGELSFCCLGRAIEVAIKHGLKISTEENEISGVVRYISDKASEISIMLNEVTDWYGFSCNNPVVVYENTAASLAELNDGEESTGYNQLTLPQIGEVIRDSFLSGGDSSD